MTNRHLDWFRQAEADLRHARNAREDGDHEWACFAAQQAAEKALKAVIQHLGGEAWGHSVTVLLGALAERLEPPAALVDAGKRLDKHYIPTRYPNGFDVGAPTDYYTSSEADAAIADAFAVLEFCVVRWADPEAISRGVEAYARDLRSRHPEVTRIIWYGSWVGGHPTPSSDVDLCVVVLEDPRRPRDRLPDYLPDRFPTGIDLVVMTEEEWNELDERAPAWQRAISSGREL